jgi:hypothetical protein
MRQCALRPCIYMTLLHYAGYMSTAVKAMQMQLIKLLTTTSLIPCASCPWEARACAAAASHVSFHKSLEILKFLHENGCPWDAQAPKAACYDRSLTTVRYLHEQGCPFDTSAFAAAACVSHLDILSYMHEHGKPWDATACTEAAGRGHLDALRYLDEHGCPHDGLAACNAAARGGHINTLRYMHELSWPWDAVRACEMAAVSGSVDMIKYIVEQDSLVLTAAQLTKMLNAAGQFSKLGAAQWLRQEGAQWPAALIYNDHYSPQWSRAYSWHGDTLAWAREQGCTSSIDMNVSLRIQHNTASLTHGTHYHSTVD